MRLKYIKVNKVFIILILILQSCVSKKQILYLQDLETTDIDEISLNQNNIQENDILKIDVTSFELTASLPYNITSQSGAGINGNLNIVQLDGYLVSANKTINFPVLGEISVADKTLKDLENHLKEKLENEGHLIKPTVKIRLLNAKVTVLGEVRNPGTFTFTENNLSLLQVLGLAGDLTIDGNRKDIIIIRQVDGKRVIENIDLTSAKWLTGPFQNIQPNDVVIVNPNVKKVKSAGLAGNISTVLSIASTVLSTIILITR